MEKIMVEYQAGPSRHSSKGIDFMLADVDGIELYAELENLTDDETSTYEDLKAAILEQAKENGIDPESLSFRYDD